jgi:hypothetical protein
MVNQVNQNVLWQPSPEAVRAAQVTAFREALAASSGRALPDTDALHAYSVSEPGAFWSAVWDFVGVVGDKGDRVLHRRRHAMPGARWFPDARLNRSRENLLECRRADDAEVALVFLDERGTTSARVVSLRVTLHANRRRVHGERADRALGVGAGDSVAAFMPNMPETIVAYVLFSSGTTGTCPSASSTAPEARCCSTSRNTAALRHRTRRPPLLLHDVRLDDVELAGLGAWPRARRSCSTTAHPFQPATTLIPALRRARRALTVLGTSARKWLDSLRQGWASRPRHASPGPPAHVLSTGSPLSPETFDWVYEAVPADDLQLSSHLRRHRHVSCFVLGARTSARPPARSNARPRHGRRSMDDHGRPVRGSRARRTRVHGAVPVDAARASGPTPTGRATIAAYFDKVSRHLEPRRLRVVDRARRHDRARPLRHHAQPRRRAHRHRRDLPASRVIDSVDRGLVFGQQWDDDVRVVLPYGCATARRSTRRSSSRSAA